MLPFSPAACLDVAVLPSPCPCCLCWCDVPLLAQVRNGSVLHHCSAWLLLCMSLPGQLGLCQFPELCLGWLSLTKTFCQLWLPSAPRCCPLSSAQGGTELLTPLSVLSVSLQPLLGKACL